MMDLMKTLTASAARITQLREEGKLKGHKTPLGYIYEYSDVDRLVAARARSKGGRE